MKNSNYARQIGIVGNPAHRGIIIMPSDNPWFLITHYEIEVILKRLHTLEGELPGTRQCQVCEITGILRKVRGRGS